MWRVAVARIGSGLMPLVRMIEAPRRVLLRGCPAAWQSNCEVAPSFAGILGPDCENPTMKILVTGSSGVIGCEAVADFDRQGHDVVGVDNNMRREFFGAAGDTLWNLERLKKSTKRFQHAALDIRDRAGIDELFRAHKFDLIVHCAAQPSHDKARDIPLLDFEVNALGTINLLEATRQRCPEAVFVLFSTNKVYGDAPNEIPMKELATRWDYVRPEDHDGIDETCRIDRTLHSLFGAS